MGLQGILYAKEAGKVSVSRCITIDLYMICLSVTQRKRFTRFSMFQPYTEKNDVLCLFSGIPNVQAGSRVKAVYDHFTDFDDICLDHAGTCWD
jgi:hypothetical protein